MTVMRLELRHLRTMCAIADAGSLGKAALALDLSQPAISKQLTRLEQMLGAELFTRSSGGTEPTSFGREVLDQAREILSRVDALGRLHVGDSPSNAVALHLGATITPVLPGMVARIKAAYPMVSLTVRSEYAIGTLLHMLEDGQIDAALVLDYPGRELRAPQAIASRPYATEPVFVALPGNHRLAQRVDVPLAELSQEAWFITPDDGAGWPEVFYEACRGAGFSPIQTHEFLGDNSLQKLIAAGVGVTPCQPTMKPMHGVVVKPLEGLPVRVRQLLAWHRDGPAAPLAADLHRFAAEAYRELVTQAPHYTAWRQRQALA